MSEKDLVLFWATVWAVTGLGALAVYARRRWWRDR